MSRRTLSAQGGSVFQRKDGYWVASIRIGRGKRVDRYAKTETAAYQTLATLQRQYYIGTLTPATKLTLSEWLTEWLQQREGQLRPSSLRTYRMVLTRLSDCIGHSRLDKATPALIANGLAQLRKKGMGSRRVQMAHAYCRAAFNDAVRQGVIGYNPAERIPNPKHEASEQAEWNREQMKAWLHRAMNSPYQHAPLLAFLLGSGLRFGEAIGLRWTHLDLQQGVITIRRAIVWEGNSRNSVQGPKTKHGLRSVTLPDFCIDILRALPRPLNDDAPVFKTATGTTPAQSVVGATMRKLCQQADVPSIPPHGLRHCHSALLLADGLDLQALRRRLGHARVDMSVNRYAYALRPDAEAAEAVQRALS